MVQKDLFRPRLVTMIDLNHPLVKLSKEIDWSAFDAEFGKFYAPDFGRPGIPIRVMAGIHYLKYMFNVSDESSVERFVENPYWQYFCGLEYFEHKVPCHPTQLVKWRKRIGAKGCEKMLKETIEAARRGGALNDTELKRVNVDTTVQEKAVAYPTDARLFHKMRIRLVREATSAGIDLRQSYCRLGKRALLWYGRSQQAKKTKLARKNLRKLRTYLGRVIRDVRRKMDPANKALQYWVEMAEKVFGRSKNEKNKIYSVHAPEVECIAKGKAHKKYEFGCKTSVASTSASGWVVGVHAFSGNPYDGHTISDALWQVKQLTGHWPEYAFVDHGYKGGTGSLFGTRVHMAGDKTDPHRAKLRSWLKRRAAVEPLIGHLKADHRMDRNFLLGEQGDRINALLAGCGFNLTKALRGFFLRLFLMFQERIRRDFLEKVRKNLQYFFRTAQIFAMCVTG